MEFTQTPFSPIDENTIHLEPPNFGTPTVPEPHQGTFDIIKRFLDSSSSDLRTAEETAVAADAVTVAAATELIIPANDPDQFAARIASDPTTNGYHLANYVSSIFSGIVTIATQIPPNHIYRWRLVALVRALSGQPSPLPSVSDAFSAVSGDGPLSWERLPTFSFLLWDLFTSRGRWEGRRRMRASDDWSEAEWLNVNAFVSLLLVDGLVRERAAEELGLDELAMKLLRHVLDEKRGREALEDNVPAAAVWILTAGPRLRERLRRGVVDDVVGGTTDSSEQEGEPRWRAWKAKFQTVIEDDRLTDGTKAWARRALGHME